MLNVNRIGAIANLLFGGWLMLSSIFWRDSPAQAYNTLVVGALAVAFALLALRRTPFAEVGNVALAAWLFVSPLVLPGGTAGITAHHLLLATLLFGFAAPPLAKPENVDIRRRGARA
jgi:hypothetical protein